MRLRTILIGGAVVAASFAVSLKAIDWLAPRADVKAPVLAPLAPLKTVRSSSIVVPVAIPLTAIRDLVEQAAPRNFSGKAANPAAQILQNGDISWTAARGDVAVSGAQNQLMLATPLSGSIAAKGSLSGNAKDAVGNALGKLLGGKVADKIGVNIKSFNATADLKGNIVMTAKPTLLPNWRVEPHLAAQVVLGDSTVSIAGARLDVPAQIKPVIDKAINDQLAPLQDRISRDGGLESAARREWTKICRIIPLNGAAVAQGLWLEIKPVRAVAGQPRVDSGTLTLLLGIEAQTRVVTEPTKPECPFPATLDIVGSEAAGVQIAVPVDIPFAELNRIIEAQYAGKTFPENGNGAAEVTVKRATVAPSGDRLLISLLVSAKDKSSLFGLTGEATLHIWGKPVLDADKQMLRLANLELAVESEAAFGLLGPAARVAVPILQKILADKATIDLKPAASNVQQRLGNMIAQYQRNEDGLRISSEISSLKLTALDYDETVMRITAEAVGLINVAITKLPQLAKPQ